MTLDLPQMVADLKNRVGADNVLTDADSEYVADIDSALTLRVNLECSTALILSGVAYTGAVLTAGEFIGTPAFVPMLYVLTLLAAELLIEERKLEAEIPMAISAKSPAGMIRGRDVPIERRNALDKKTALYTQMRDLYLYGPSTGLVAGLDMRQVLFNRDVPIDTQSIK